MAGIEWQESLEYLPNQRSLQLFCQDNNISESLINCDQRLVAFIESSALEGLYDFCAHDISREHGGVLIGQSYVDPLTNCVFVVIKAAIPAQDTEGTPVHLQFTANTWSFISGIIEENHPTEVIVGWYHSHPGLGVFMSGTDRATQKAFFNHIWSLAVVVDPIAQKTGWFSGPGCEPLERSRVIPFEMPAKRTETTPERESIPVVIPELHRKNEWRRLGWLLPFVGILFIVGVGGILFLRKNSQNRIGSS